MVEAPVGAMAMTHVSIVSARLEVPVLRTRPATGDSSPGAVNVSLCACEGTRFRRVQGKTIFICSLKGEPAKFLSTWV